MGSTFIIALFFGPIFCGWACPYGTFHDWLSRIAVRFRGNTYKGFIAGSADTFVRVDILKNLVYNMIKITSQ